eukprot:gene15961-21660_t
MEESFNSFNLGVSWSVFGNANRSDLDNILTAKNIHGEARLNLVDLWEKISNRTVQDISSVLLEKMSSIEKSQHSFLSKLESLEKTIMDFNLKVDSKMQSMMFEVHSMKNCIFFVSQSITPSEDCKTQSEPSFLRMMNTLGLPQQMNINSLYEEYCGEDTPFNHNFHWSWGSKLEVDSYEPLIGYLRGVGFNAFDVNKGKSPSTGNLFHSAVPSFVADTRKRQLVFYVKGTSDIVVLHENVVKLYLMRRRDILMAIEVKTVSDMEANLNECLREAVIQLIGLNCANAHRSPPVFITNLVGGHFVLYLEQVNKDTDIMLKVVKFMSISQALALCVRVYSRNAITCDWGRLQTPDSNYAKGSEQEDECYGKTTITSMEGNYNYGSLYNSSDVNSTPWKNCEDSVEIDEDALLNVVKELSLSNAK